MAQIQGLVDKAKKSGISYGTLKKVYDRGMAAWKTGHRPGTTPQQWAFARVNSFITKGKTYHTADKDLRSEFDMEKDYKKKKLKEFLNQEACWDGYKQVGMKKKGNKMVPDCVPEEKNCGCGKTPCETYGTVDDNLPEQKKVDIKKMFAKVKGLSKKQLEVLASIPTPQLHIIVQQLSGLTMGEDFEPFNTIEEALSVQQRMKRGQIARRTAKKRARSAARKKRRMKNCGNNSSRRRAGRSRRRPLTPKAAERQ